MINELKNLKPGDKIMFGQYPQKAEVQRRKGIIKINTCDDKNDAGSKTEKRSDNNTPHTEAYALGGKSNTYMVKEEDILPIEWRVLSNDGKELFLVSDSSLDYIPYHSDSDLVMYFRDWDNSTLRQFLNTDFYDFAFNEDEKKVILAVTREDLGAFCTDKVFLLTESETELLGLGIKDKVAMLT